MQDVHDRQAGIQSDEIGQRQRPHRMVHAELHDRVDRLRRRDAFVDGVDRLVDHRHQHAIGDEAREIAHFDRRLSHLLGQLARELVGLLRRRDAADDLDQLHDRHRIHEVHADDALRPPRGRAEHRNRDRRRVAGKNRPLARTARRARERSRASFRDVRSPLRSPDRRRTTRSPARQRCVRGFRLAHRRRCVPSRRCDRGFWQCRRRRDR